MATASVEIVVPDGCSAGMDFTVEWGGTSYNITVPYSVTAGQLLTIELPALQEETVATHPTGGMQPVEIVVPDGCTPGMEFTVEWGGVSYTIAVPEGVWPGQPLTIELPELPAEPAPSIQEEEEDRVPEAAGEHYVGKEVKVLRSNGEYGPATVGPAGSIRPCAQRPGLATGRPAKCLCSPQLPRSACRPRVPRAYSGQPSQPERRALAAHACTTRWLPLRPGRRVQPCGRDVHCGPGRRAAKVRRGERIDRGGRLRRPARRRLQGGREGDGAAPGVLCERARSRAGGRLGRDHGVHVIDPVLGALLQTVHALCIAHTQFHFVRIPPHSCTLCTPCARHA